MYTQIYIYIDRSVQKKKAIVSRPAMVNLNLLIQTILELQQINCVEQLRLQKSF